MRFCLALRPAGLAVVRPPLCADPRSRCALPCQGPPAPGRLLAGHVALPPSRGCPSRTRLIRRAASVRRRARPIGWALAQSASSRAGVCDWLARTLASATGAARFPAAVRRCALWLPPPCRVPRAPLPGSDISLRPAFARDILAA